MTSRAKTIQIFLPDGNPRGIKIADITSRSIFATLIPRIKLEDAQKVEEISNVGIYLLIGEEEEGGSKVYIGEAEDCLKRIKQHNATKDFWQFAIAITSKSQQFTKSHVKFLEWYCYQEAKKSSRYEIENSTIPNKPHITKPVEADLLDYFETMQILVSTLGYPIFDELRTSDKKDIIYCKGKTGSGEGEYTEDGLVVFKGSKCHASETKSAPQWIISLRKKLLDKGILVKEDNVYIFSSDYKFKTPTGSAVVILGRNANGWTAWKYKNGKTLDDVIRKGV
jgi:hypothetical protein